MVYIIWSEILICPHCGKEISFIDSFSGLTAREQKALEKSWAKVFADEIFPAIDEKRFSDLYSDKTVVLMSKVEK